MRYSNMILTAEEYNILWECLSQIKNDLNIFKPEIFYVKSVHSVETREYFEKKQKNIEKNVSLMFKLLEQLYKQTNIFQNLNRLQFVLNKVKERV